MGNPMCAKRKVHVRVESDSGRGLLPSKGLGLRPVIWKVNVPDAPTKYWLLTQIETQECYMCFHRVVWSHAQPAPAICWVCSAGHGP